MDFVRSRLAVVGLLVAWPCAQLAGCAVKDREYGPASEGGSAGTDMNGGTGGSKGGTSGKTGSGGSSGGDLGGANGTAGENDMTGGTGTGGTGGTSRAGTGGATNRGGTGGATNRGGTGGTETAGAAGEAGASGEAGISAGGSSTGGSSTGGNSTGGNSTGGTAGSGPACIPTGTTEICTDGIDNDCDGTTDCITLTSEFPTKTGAASASDVAYAFTAPAAGATYQCRNTHGNSTGGNFGACGSVSGNTVHPFTDGFAVDATNDGLWTTEVRQHFPSGGNSAIYKRTVYVHHTLHGVTRCPATATDQQYAAFAQAHLGATGAFDQTTVKSPFVKVTFSPVLSGTYDVTGADGIVYWKSLRRNFGFSSDGQYMVMTRTYTSQNPDGMGCFAAVKRVHQTRGSWDVVTGAVSYQKCTALVFNRDGAGYCLAYSGGVISSAEHVRGDYGAQIPSPYEPEADNFAWRKMTAAIEGGASTNFSPKCDTTGCATGYTIFLPDKGFFPYFTQ